MKNKIMSMIPFDDEPQAVELTSIEKEANLLEKQLEEMGTPSVITESEDEYSQQNVEFEETVAPAEPVVTPAEPIITPAEPVITPVVPAEPVVTPVAPTEPVTPAEPAKKPMEPDDVFTALVKAKNGELSDDDAVNSRAASLAMGIAGKLDVEAILKVVKKAQEGGYGASSVDILVEAKDALTMAQANESVQRKQTEQQTRIESEFQAKTRESVSVVMKDDRFKDLNDPSTDMSKFMVQWRERNIGTTDANGNVLTKGPLASIMVDPSWPSIFANLMYNEFQAGVTSSLKKTVDEIKQKGKDLSPLPSNGRPASSTGGHTADADKEADELESQLKGLGMMRK